MKHEKAQLSPSTVNSCISDRAALPSTASFSTKHNPSKTIDPFLFNTKHGFNASISPSVAAL